MMNTGEITELLENSVRELERDGWTDQEISRLLTLLYVRIQDDVQYGRRRHRTGQELKQIKRRIHD